jgi:hypothetical protein
MALVHPNLLNFTGFIILFGISQPMVQRSHTSVFGLGFDYETD